jgi:hypothetical protein
MHPMASARATVDGSALDGAATVLAEQRRFNRETRELWDGMASHRKRVTREALRIAPKQRACILGAGNCNDLELAALKAGFDEVHLVDIDGEALALGIERQGLSSDPAIRAHPGVDIAGFSELGPTADSTHIARVFRSHGARFDTTLKVPRCDVVVSCCVLSQLIGTLVTLLGANHPQSKELAVVLREAHLELLLEHTLPGGSLLFISDMVSSDTAPELHDCPDVGLAKLRDELIGRHNYFHGTNPHLIERWFSAQSSRAGRIERRPPWRWRFGERAFLVTALRVERQGRATSE